MHGQRSGHHGAQGSSARISSRPHDRTPYYSDSDESYISGLTDSDDTLPSRGPYSPPGPFIVDPPTSSLYLPSTSTSNQGRSRDQRPPSYLTSNGSISTLSQAPLLSGHGYSGPPVRNRGEHYLQSRPSTDSLSSTSTRASLPRDALRRATIDVSTAAERYTPRPEVWTGVSLSSPDRRVPQQQQRQLQHATAPPQSQSQQQQHAMALQQRHVTTSQRSRRQQAASQAQPEVYSANISLPRSRTRSSRR